jgi:hypothetical protein
VADLLDSPIGSDGLLGGLAVRVAITHGVQIIGDDGLVAETRSVAEFARRTPPTPQGSLLYTDGQRYRLDSLLEHDGYTERWALLPLPPVSPP